MSYANLQEKSFMSHTEGNLEMITFFKWKTIKRNKAIFLRRRKTWKPSEGSLIINAIFTQQMCRFVSKDHCKQTMNGTLL